MLIIQLLPLLLNAICLVESADWLARNELVIKLLDTVFEGGSMKMLTGNAANAHYHCARIYAEREDGAKAKYHLEKLAECVKNYDGDCNSEYGGALFKDYTVVSPVVIKNTEETLKETYSQLLGSEESPMFDRFSETEWFKAVEKEICE